MSDYFELSDLFLLAQWFAIFICAVIGVTESGEGVGKGSSYKEVCLFLMINALVGYSLYDDYQMWYKYFSGLETVKEKLTLLEMLNFSPVVGVGRILAFVGLMSVFQSLSNDLKDGGVLMIIAIINLLAGIASIPFALI